ncbi:MAG: hypothetical protein AMJ95_07475 [Omnitrophica WOR_2 bacterium SM23_72]|nr:MAG: hypothetical protein AMJ95_07475 [Omnitrophica WOR_2 bacterium SM23_72]
MILKKLNVKDRRVFEKFLGLNQHELSVYAWENILIWKGLYDIRWALLDKALCVFFIDKIGCFQYLTPLGKNINGGVLRKSFEVMDAFNKNKEISRIENIESKDIWLYRKIGYNCRIKSYDYLCNRLDLAQLPGNRFKSKRACCNYFVKNFSFEYQPFSLRYKKGCLSLYNLWMEQRKAQRNDFLYRGMLKDSQACLKEALDSFVDLDLTGRVVTINNEVRGFTFGYELNQETFCVLFEITDLTVKGLAQFIFREFSRELKNYKYINIMDDSGLKNLREVKHSYQPVQLVPSFTLARRYA